MFFNIGSSLSFIIFVNILGMIDTFEMGRQFKTDERSPLNNNTEI